MTSCLLFVRFDELLKHRLDQVRECAVLASRDAFEFGSERGVKSK
ncbi:MAG: hypothetical protein ACLPWS_20770 [Rhodomicrobium sp.]